EAPGPRVATHPRPQAQVADGERGGPRPVRGPQGPGLPRRRDGEAAGPELPAPGAQGRAVRDRHGAPGPAPPQPAQDGRPPDLRLRLVHEARLRGAADGDPEIPAWKSRAVPDLRDDPRARRRARAGAAARAERRAAVDRDERLAVADRVRHAGFPEALQAERAGVAAPARALRRRIVAGE